MSHQNVIDLGFDVPGISDEQKQVIAIFQELFDKLEKYDGTKFNPLAGGGLGDLRKSITDGTQALTEMQTVILKYNDTITAQAQKQSQTKKATDELTLATKEYEKTQAQLAQTQAKNNAGSSDASAGLALEKEALRQRNAELSNAAKLQLAEADSINEAKARIAELTAERNQVNTATDEGQATIARINAEIDKNNELIRENSSTLEKQKINIGNYPKVIGLLQESLAGIEGKLEAMAAAGQQATESFQKLTLEQKILQGSLDRQTEGFTNINGALRNTKNTLDAMTLAGLENTEAFEKLNLAYTEAEQRVKDLHREQAILTTDEPALAALTSAVKGLGGAYALAQGASALFAEGDEKVEKELNKLVAVMTFLQGLTEAVNALKEKNAIASALEAAATKALVFVKEIEARLFGETAAAAEAETAIKEVNTEVTEANTGAIEVNTAAAEVSAVAMEGIAAATELATAATIGFRTALISTGIGAIIIGIIYGITKLVGAISDWVNADERAEATQKALTQSTSELLEVTKQLNEAYTYYGKERIEDLKNQAALIQDAGKNTFLQLEAERAISSARLEQAQKFVANNKISQQSVDELQAKQVFALENVKGFEEILWAARKKAGEDDSKINKKRVEELEKIVEQQKADAKNITSEYEQARDALKEVTDSQRALEENRTKTAKAAADQLADITDAAAQRRYDIEKDANDRILSLPGSTEAEKLRALRSNYAVEAQLSATQVAAVEKQVRDEVITEQEGAKQIEDIDAALAIKRKKNLDDQTQLIRAYHERNRDAALESLKAETDERIKADQDIQQGRQNNPNPLQSPTQVPLSDRLKGLSEEYDARRDLLNAELSKELDAEGLNQKEKKAIYDKYGADIADLFRDQQKTYLQLENEAREQSLKQWDLYYAKRKEQIDQTEADEIKLLNDRNVADREYAQERQRIEDDAALARAQAAVNDAEIQVNATKDGTQAHADAQDKLDEASKNLSDRLKKNSDDHKKALVEDAEEGIDELQNYASAVVDIGDIGYNRQKANIEKLEVQQERSYEKEEAAIQTSTINEEDKANRLKVLDDQRQQQKEINDRKQRQLDNQKAEYDKAKDILGIITGTALAVVKALPNIPLAVSVGILGAAELAAAIATPIPHYKTGAGINGKPFHPGGLAITGDGFEHEIIAEPGRKPYLSPAVPTAMNLLPMTQVIPLSFIDQMSKMWVTDRGILAYQPVNDETAMRLEQLNQTMLSQTERFERAVARNNRPIVIQNNIGRDLNHLAWVRKNVFD